MEDTDDNHGWNKKYYYLVFAHVHYLKSRDIQAFFLWLMDGGR